METKTISNKKKRSPKQQFLDAYEREHLTTMRVLKAYPPDQLDLKPHPTCRSAKELAWVFVLERGLGALVFKNEFETNMSRRQPDVPSSWATILDALESAHLDFGDLIRSTPEEALYENVRFFVKPKTMGDVSRFDWLWFLLHDQIHHRGQFSVYLRMAGGKVPSIYGPSGDEKWS